MTVYRITEDPTKFKTLSLLPSDLAEQLGDFELVRDILHQPSHNSSLQPIWGKVNSEFADVLKKDSETPDISIWCNTFLIFSPKAFYYLHNKLSTYGEFLPINVGSETWYFYTALTFARENKQLTIPKVEYGELIGFETLAFDEEDTQDKYIFKSLEEGPVNLFCTDIFRELVTEHKLTGVGFSEDLTGLDSIDESV
ncbi:hypothetical protein [Vibrio diabolicus]|uniref:Uncharacterized protein n=1 Tax=Vibrio diabolicus TaxID=50719 RepID=A0AAX1XTM1_9VIBR|nr:hypothetical protein [Vibrio diabolicus]MCS0349269.1 hypothetical protein [Vibrio diabolicus]MCS0362562.1 hypothetical protein [Vibrio diabolicus]MCS0375387.1 hypothetical protein [Vibrio diabolicus]MCS0428181.1 hypothetical protein [Vibrio diabolicus]MCS0442090.1 hypothetical protein [Vibrio diabolicus]